MQTKAGAIPPSRCALVTLINEFAEPTQLRPSSSSWMHVTWTHTSATTRVFMRVNRAWRHQQCSCKTFSPKAVALRMLAWSVTSPCCSLNRLTKQVCGRGAALPSKLYSCCLLHVLPAVLTTQSGKQALPYSVRGFLASKASSSH